MYFVKHLLNNELPLYIYKNIYCLDRYYFVNNVAINEDFKSVIYELSRSDMDRLRNTVFIEIKYRDQLSLSPPRQVGMVRRIIHSMPDEIQLEVEVQGPSILVFSVNYSSNWKCYTDGEQTTIVPANGTFMCVALNSGTKDVRLVYGKQ